MNAVANSAQEGNVKRFAGQLLVILALLAACCLAAGPAGAAVKLPAPQWAWAGGPYWEQFRDIGFGDELHGYAVAGDCGYVSADGGHTWTRQESHGGLWDIDFAGPRLAWIVGDAGAIETTTDGGQTWQAQASGVTETLRSVDFVDSANGWACTATGDIISTGNGGTTWTVAGSIPSETRAELSFADRDHGWAMSRGDLWRTDDGGLTWRRDPALVTHGSLYFVRFFDAQHGWTGGYDGVWKTQDGGDTWVLVESLPYYVTDVASTGDWRHVWAVVGDRMPFASSDGGQTWHMQTIDTTYLSQGDVEIVVVGDHGWMTTVASAYSGCGIVHTDLSGYSDAYAPLTTVQPATTDGWCTAPLGMTLSATDAGSGVTDTYYQVNRYGGEDWRLGTSFTVPLDGKDGEDGTYQVQYMSSDAYGNVEGVNRLYVKIDLHPPVTTLTPGAPTMLDYWTNKESVVRVKADDGYGAGVAATWLTLDGGAQQQWAGADIVTQAPADHSNDGVHTISVRSVDEVGHQEVQQQHVVAVDTRKPTAKAPYPASCASRGYASVKFRIDDARPCAGKGQVLIRFFDAHGRLAGYIAPGAWFTTGKVASTRFKCRLKRGTYSFKVTAYDGAGNKSTNTARNRLTVK
jgi:photosystem II stability/assembly factor-like uncharacterized protein